MTTFRTTVPSFNKTAVPKPIKTGYFQDLQNWCWGPIPTFS